MTPTLTQLLIGQAAAIAAPQPEEAGGDYMASRLGMVAMLATLAAQEAERGPAARLWENAAVRALLEGLDLAYGEPLADRTADDDRSWSGLDRENAALRRLLIAAHEQAEARGDREVEAGILDLYVAMAGARRLELPSALD